MKLIIFDAFNRISTLEIERTANFLYKHLGPYGDAKSAIRKAILYAAKERAGLGGHVFTIEDKNEIIGAAVVNKTGMDEYIPENILVYIAVHKDYRGRGIGKKLMQYVLKNCKGDIALHVQKDNPAKSWCERMGFTNSHLEMRWERNKQ